MGLLDKLIEKKDLVAYLRLRTRRLKDNLKDIKKYPEKNREMINQKIQARIKEINKLGGLITSKKLREASKKYWRHFNTQIPVSSIDGKPMPEEAVKGLTKAIKDVKEGRYESISTADPCTCGHERGDHYMSECNICECDKFKLKEKEEFKKGGKE